MIPQMREFAAADKSSFAKSLKTLNALFNIMRIMRIWAASCRVFGWKSAETPPLLFRGGAQMLTSPPRTRRKKFETPPHLGVITQ